MKFEGGLRVSINEKDNSASVIKSPKATRIVFVPRYAEYKNNKYKIISIDQNAFKGNNIEFLTFPEDSEVISFKSHSFLKIHIKKLRITPKLKHLSLTEIEISPQNHLFIYFDHKYLLGKSQEKFDKFDQLILARRDIEEAVIPPHFIHSKHSKPS